MTSAAHQAKEDFEAVVEAADDFIWGPALIVLIMAAGVYLTVRTRFVQARYLGTALKSIFRDESDGRGEVSTFGALCTSLAATIGTGNIVGAASAVAAGGPGALLWMLAAAFFGMATKYAEGLLAIKYRRETSPGRFSGGPFCYIERGLGREWKPLGVIFAFFGAAAGLMGIGTITQINGITNAISGVIDPCGKNTAFTIGGESYTWAVVVSGAAVTLAAGLVIIGGVRRIAKVSEIIVPFMAGIYIFFTLTILIMNRERVPGAVRLIFAAAFDPSAAGGALSGAAIGTVIQKGVERGIFSNEAGLGSAPIAAAAARTNDPARQGLVAMTGTFIDTMIVCTLTGLTVTVTGAWDPRVTGGALEGVEITDYAWRSGLPFDPRFSSVMLAICLVFFAFTTIIGWNCYGEKCLEYLCGGRPRMMRAYRCAYIAAVLAGPYLTVSAAWGIADVFNGLMALPNLIALILLAPKVSEETRAFARRQRHTRRPSLPERAERQGSHGKGMIRRLICMLSVCDRANFLKITIEILKSL